MLSIIFSKVLLLSLMGSFLVILIVLAKKVCREWLSPKWHYYIWFLVVLRLLIPFTPQINFDFIFQPSVVASNNEPTNTTSTGTEALTQNSSNSNKSPSDSDTSVQNTGTYPLKEEKATEKISLSADNLSTTIHIASIIWAIGAVLLLCYITVINFILRKKVIRSSIPITNPRLKAIFMDSKKMVGIGNGKFNNIPLVLQTHVKTPSIIGILKPCLLFPANLLGDLGDRELKFIVVHELIHFKRKDTIFNMLQIILCIIHWFNPFIWYASSKLKEEREPVCDELVLKLFSKSESTYYAKTLIKLLESFSNNSWSYSLAGMGVKNASALERRLKMFINFKKRSKSVSLSLILVLIILGSYGVLKINSAVKLPTFTSKAHTFFQNKSVTPTRGNISDRDGNELAVSIQDDKTGNLKRSYPHNKLAAQVIGFVDEKNKGLTGIEASMEDYLKIQDNKSSLKSGMNVILTIDSSIQSIVERSLDNAIQKYQCKNGASAIVMNPKTGEILAMASKPDFDLNSPLVDKGLWKNTNISSTFEPVSTFKIITAAAGIEEGVVTPETIVSDEEVKVSGYSINCWNPGFHGKETFGEALSNSCNPPFVKVASDLGVDKYYSYLRNFGLYDKTLIELPDEADSLLHKKPGILDMSTASFGQRFLITPLRLASLYGAIANNGTYLKPQIIKGVEDADTKTIKTISDSQKKQIFSPKTAKTLNSMLRDCILNGNAKDAFESGIDMAGHTGTGEKVDGKFFTIFSGYAPSNNPEYVLTVVLDEPGSPSPSSKSTVAPTANDIMKKLLLHKNKK